MKLYIHYDGLAFVKIEREKPFYQGSNFIDRIRILLDEANEAYSPTIMFKLPTGRRIGPVYPIGIDARSTRLINEEGKTWYFYDFIISSEVGLLAYPGQLEASVILNYYNTAGTIIKQAVVGTVVNEIVKTTVYGEGNIIVVGEDPEVILNNLNLTIANLANRQSSIEEVWTYQISKLIPVIKNYLNDSEDTRIEFYDDFIKIVHAGKIVATFDCEDGLIVNGDIEGEDLTLTGDIRADCPSAQATFNNVVAKDAFIEYFSSDDINTGDVYASNDVHIGEESVKGYIKKLNRFAEIIVNSLDEETACLYFSDNIITIVHKGEDMVHFSAEDGTRFYSNVQFDKEVEMKGKLIGEAAEFNDVCINEKIEVSGDAKFWSDIIAEYALAIFKDVDCQSIDVSENIFLGGKNLLRLFDNYNTKEEVAVLLDKLPKMKFKKVTRLPSSGIDSETIYLVPSALTENANIFTEYIYIDKKWEKIGTTKLDLSNYVQLSVFTATKESLTKEIDHLTLRLRETRNLFVKERERAIAAEKALEAKLAFLVNRLMVTVTNGIMHIGKPQHDVYVDDDGVLCFTNGSATFRGDGVIIPHIPYAIVDGILII